MERMKRSKSKHTFKTGSVRGIKSYIRSHLKFDLIAGFTAAMVAIPQSMAYAIIAGLNPIYGLYTAILPTIIGALFGSSNHLATGPTNANALIVATTLVAISSQPDYIEYIFAVAVVCGVMQLMIGIFRLGNLIRYVSNSVLTGFLAGVGILIIVRQVGNLLGLEQLTGENTVALLGSIFHELLKSNPYVVITGCLSLFVILVGSRLQRRLPVPLIVIVLGSILIHLLGWHQAGVRLASDLGSINPDAYGFHIPKILSLDMGLIIRSAIAVTLLSMVQTVSVAKSIGFSTGQKIDPSRELIGQGLASISAGVTQSMPSSGSPTRSAVILMAGGKTRVANVFSGFTVLFAVLGFSEFIGRIPIAVLAAVVICSAFRIIDIHHVMQTLRSRSVSRLVFFTTFLATIMMPLHYAIYLGTALSIGIFLYESGNVSLSFLVPNSSGEFIECRLEDLLKKPPRVAIINIEGEFHFAAMDEMQMNLEKILESNIQVLILRVRGIRHMASTGVIALESLIDYAQRRGTKVILCGVTGTIEETLRATGITSLVGEEQEFLAREAIFKSTKLALERANRIINHSIPETVAQNGREVGNQERVRGMKNVS